MTVQSTISATVAHSVQLTRRSVRGRLRQPAQLAPAFIFPLFFAALGAASFHKLAQDPYFTENIATSFLNYAIAGALVQGVLFGSVSAASDLATDIEQGFFERLIASPVSRVSIVVGRLGGGVAIALVQSVVFLAIFMAFGARVHSGPLGLIGIIVSNALLGLAISGMVAGLAIKSGSPEVVQGSFPLVFVTLFLSSTFFPRHYMTGWYRHVADWNPMSHIVEGMQGFMNHDLEWSQFVRAWIIPFIISVVGIAFALRSLSKRLAAA